MEEAKQWDVRAFDLDEAQPLDIGWEPFAVERLQGRDGHETVLVWARRVVQKG